MSSSSAGESIAVKVYIDPSSTCDIQASPDWTIGGLRNQVYTEAMTVLGDRSGTVRKDSIVISSDLHGSSKFDDHDLTLGSLPCDISLSLFAIVPTSKTGSSPEASAAPLRKGKDTAKWKERLAEQQATLASGKKANTMALVHEIDKQRQVERDNWKKATEDLRRDLEMDWATKLTESLSARDKDWETKLDESLSARDKDWEARMSTRDKSWEARMSESLSARDKVWEARMSESLSARDKVWEAKLAKNNREWEAWRKRMEAAQAVLQAENETLTTTCDKLRKEADKSTKDFAAQVAWQARVEADLGLLDAIVLRNLIDQAQALLAQAAGLPIDKDTRPSFAWGMLLAAETSDSERLNGAKFLFAQRDDEHAKAAKQVLESEGGMLLVERPSVIREKGDDAAHGPMSRFGVSPTVARQPSEKRGAIISVVMFVCGP